MDHNRLEPAMLIGGPADGRSWLADHSHRGVAVVDRSGGGSVAHYYPIVAWDIDGEVAIAVYEGPEVHWRIRRECMWISLENCWA